MINTENFPKMERFIELFYATTWVVEDVHIWSCKCIASWKVSHS